MDAVKTLESKTKVLNIFIEEDPQNPREDDNMGTMICNHRRYSLGDKEESKNFDFDAYNGWSEVFDALMKEHDTAVILPLFLYDHSGITMKTTPFGCRWDSGQVGFIFVSKERVRKEYNVKRITKKLLEQVTKCLINEVKVYDMYLTGDIYRFVVTDKEGKHLDSCGGFFGNDFATNGIAEYLDTELAELLK